MAYLHCHNCGWSQDDFWTENYNPITFLEKNYKDDLLNKDLDKIVKMDKNFFRENSWFFKESPEIEQSKFTQRRYLIYQLSKAIKKIEKMEYKTEDEFRAARERKEFKCPVCGSSIDWDID